MVRREDGRKGGANQQQNVAQFRPLDPMRLSAKHCWFPAVAKDLEWLERWVMISDLKSLEDPMLVLSQYVKVRTRKR